MKEQEFLEKYNISVPDFKKAGINFKVLTDIQEDYAHQFQKLDDAGANLVRTLLRFPSVHSVKYRIKDPEHLMAKIVMKLLARPKLEINVQNYRDKIQDLIGIRILHLFKSDWNTIHEKLIGNFKMIGKPEANVRKGDLADFVNYYKANGCKIRNHPAGYRSVHYLIKTEPTKKPLICEIQVRTIFEEAWSEIDHTVRYPYFTDSQIVNQYLTIFNRLAGSADEMGGFVLNLKKEALLNAKNVLELENLKSQIQKSSMKETEKRDMEKGLESIVLPSIQNITPAFEHLRKTSEALKGLDSPLRKGIFSPEVQAAIATIKTSRG